MPEEFNGIVAFCIAIHLSEIGSFASENSTRKLSNGDYCSSLFFVATVNLSFLAYVSSRIEE